MRPKNVTESLPEVLPSLAAISGLEVEHARSITYGSSDLTILRKVASPPRKYDFYLPAEAKETRRLPSDLQLSVGALARISDDRDNLERGERKEVGKLTQSLILRLFNEAGEYKPNRLDQAGMRSHHDDYEHLFGFLSLRGKIRHFQTLS